MKRTIRRTNLLLDLGKVRQLRKALRLRSNSEAVRRAVHTLPSRYRDAILVYYFKEKNLAEARERGYAWTLEELEIGLHAMAAPIRDQEGQVVAAISASGPSYRFTEERMHELAPVLLKGAEEISHRMGYLG